MLSTIFLAGYYPEESMQKVRTAFMENARARGLELFDAGEGIVNTQGLADGAGRKALEHGGPCALVFCSWMNEEIANRLAQRLRELPTFMVGFDGPSEYISLSGVLATSSNMLHLGLPNVALIGNIHEDRLWKGIMAAHDGAQAALKLRDTRIGLVGSACPGMLGMTCGDSDLQRLGPQVIHISLADVIDKTKSRMASKTSVELVERDMAGLNADGRCDGNTLALAGALYHELRSRVDDTKLDALAIKCWPELPRVLGTTPCYAISRLEDEGIVGSCEADMLSATTQIVLRCFSKSATFTGDIAGYNEGQGVLHLWHTGAAPRSMTGCMATVEPSAMGLPGISVSGNLKLGRVALAKLARPIDGSFRLFVASGEEIAGPESPGNNAYVRTDVPVQRVVECLQENGMEHHLALSYMECADAFRFFARFSGIRLVTPD